MKKIPQGIWKDTEVDNRQLKVLYYDSRVKGYRIEYSDMGLRVWAPVNDFGPGKRFQSLGLWGLLRQQQADLRAGVSVPTSADFSL